MRRKIRLTVLLLILILSIPFCLMVEDEIFYYDYDLKPYVELVMYPGQRIIAKNRNGSMAIEANEGTVRKYTWKGESRKVRMIVPPPSRWYGNLGIQSPDKLWGNIKDHHGINRVVTNEGQQHFKTLDEAMKWLNMTWHRGPFDVVYNNEGIVVGWCLTHHRHQINVDVWQIFINGKKPKELPGAQDDKIKVLYR